MHVINMDNKGFFGQIKFPKLKISLFRVERALILDKIKINT